MSKFNEPNAREQLEAIASWLGYQHEDLSFGLKSPEDAIKLFRGWASDPKLPEFCDECEGEADRKRLLTRTKKILGYDPWKRCTELADAEG
jgi:hypothetical protein